MVNSKSFYRVFSEHNSKAWAVAFIVALLTVLIYLTGLQNGFVDWDDDWYVYENTHVQSIGFESLKWMFTTFHASNWHPLTWLSHAIDNAIWGLNPMGHHFSSIILHGFNTFLVVILVIRLISYAKPPLPPFTKHTPFPSREGIKGCVLSRGEYTSIIAGAVTGLLFGLHPLHVESVAWISERKDVLYAFFFLLSLISYLKYTSSLQNPPKSPFSKGGFRGINYALCIFFFMFSLMSKPMAVTLPVVLLILDIYPLRRLDLKSAFTSQRKIFIEKIPFLCLSLASSVVTIMAQKTAMVPLELHPLRERLLVGIRALCFYLIKILWPTDLAPLYPYPLKISFLTVEYMGSFILAISITAFCIWSWKRQKVFVAIWAYYVVTLLPVLGIIQVGKQATADRYTYLSSLGPMILIGLGVLWFWRKAGAMRVSLIKRLFFIIPSILIISLLSIMTIKQIKIWKDSITFWSAEFKIYSDPVAYNNRGNAYLRLDKYQQAIQDYNKAIELDPKYALAFYNRGVAYGDLEKYQQAIEDFDRAIELDPHYVNAFNNRGNVYAKIGQIDEAIENYNRAITLNPNLALPYINRGVAYMRLGNYQKTIQDYNMALTLNPKDAHFYNNRGNIHLRLGNYQKALEDYVRAIKINPRFATFYFNRAIAYEKINNLTQAIKDYDKAIELNPDYAYAFSNRGLVYEKLGNYQKTLENYNMAIRLDPSDTITYYNRGMLYRKIGDQQQAINDFQTAARLGNKKARDYLKSKGIGW